MSNSLVRMVFNEIPSGVRVFDPLDQKWYLRKGPYLEEIGTHNMNWKEVNPERTFFVRRADLHKVSEI